jgi:class 3 adenylate cyclase
MSCACRAGSHRSSTLDEIEEFLTGARHAADSERILATVMFADIVDSSAPESRSRIGASGS